MEITRLEELRPRSVWDIIDDAFDMYREHFSLFAVLSAVVFVPYILADMALTRALLGVDGGSGRAPGSAFVAYIAAYAPLSVLAYSLQFAALSIAVDDLLRSGGGGRGRAEPTIGSVYGRVLRRIFPLLVASVLVSVLMLLGLTFLLVGALVVATYYAFIAPAIVLEGRGPFAAGQRSRDIAMVSASRATGLILLIVMLLFLLTMSLEALLSVAGLVLPGAQDAGAQELRQFVLRHVFHGIADTLLAPVPAIAVTLFYFDVRVRHEGLDMEAQAQAAGIPLAPDPFGGAGFGDTAAAKKAQQRMERQRARAARRGSRQPTPPLGGAGSGSGGNP